MSKIGRKAIDISGVAVEVKGQNVHYKGAKASGVYVLPEVLEVQIADDKLMMVPNKAVAQASKVRDVNREWGLHRALLANAIAGSKKAFEKLVEITGLGYKAVQSGNKLVFTLGYSHKIDFELPKGVVIAIDRTGQKLTLSSTDREVLGLVCSKICALRRPEPYKGTGIKLSTDRIIRKASKGK
ncbi:50S ribosomal protein L6 [Candidatus Dependentiae bacterium]|nr:MAG: 50S ribosomal protein L6 [Candidatus Dependentiae bacterium]